MTKPKKNIISSTVPGSKGYHPQVGADDPVSGGGSRDDTGDVKSWLIDQLGDIHQKCRDLINKYLVTLPYNGQKSR
jgi:hypothetical protein